MEGHPVYETTADAGSTWREVGNQSTDPGGDLGYNGTGPPLSFSAVDAEHWRASVYDRVVSTDDAGRHWMRVAGGLPFRPILGLSFASPAQGWAFSLGDSAGYGGCDAANCETHLESTSDGGRTWREVALPPR